MKVIIVGAGVIGLATAVQLAENYKGIIQIKIVSDQFSPNTTGDGSAGLWGPYLLGTTDNEKILKWSSDTHRFFHQLWKEGHADKVGLCLVPVTELTTDYDEINPIWKDIVYGFQRLSDNNVNKLIEEHQHNYKYKINK